MVSEEKAAKEAGMDPENYQVGVEQGCNRGRTQQRKNLLETICFKMALKNFFWKIHG